MANKVDREAARRRAREIVAELEEAVAWVRVAVREMPQRGVLHRTRRAAQEVDAEEDA